MAGETEDARFMSAIFHTGSGCPHPDFVFASGAELEEVMWQTSDGSDQRNGWCSPPVAPEALCLCCSADCADSGDSLETLCEEATSSVARRFGCESSVRACRRACDAACAALRAHGVPRDVRRLVVAAAWDTRLHKSWALHPRSLFLPRVVVCLEIEVRPWQLSQARLREAARRLDCSLFYVSAQHPKSDAALLAPMLDLHRALRVRYAALHADGPKTKNGKSCALQ